MKRTTRALLFVLLLSPLAHAGEIFGNIEMNGRAIANAEIKIIESNGNTKVTRTDKYGSYSLYVASNGRCKLKVQCGGGQFAEIDVYSYRNPSRYDLVLNGQCALRRK